MNDFPRWLLVLAFLSVAPVFVSPLYLFGGMHLFGYTEWTAVNFLLYLAQNLVWALPVYLFFPGLDRYRRGFYKSGTAIILLGDVLAVLSAVLPFV